MPEIARKYLVKVYSKFRKNLVSVRIEFSPINMHNFCINPLQNCRFSLLHRGKKSQHFMFFFSPEIVSFFLENFLFSKLRTLLLGTLSRRHLRFPSNSYENFCCPSPLLVIACYGEVNIKKPLKWLTVPCDKFVSHVSLFRALPLSDLAGV